MMQRMVYDVMVFTSILIIIVVGYGTAFYFLLARHGSERKHTIPPRKNATTTSSSRSQSGKCKATNRTRTIARVRNHLCKYYNSRTRTRTFTNAHEIDVENYNSLGMCFLALFRAMVGESSFDVFTVCARMRVLCGRVRGCRYGVCA